MQLTNFIKLFRAMDYSGRKFKAEILYSRSNVFVR